MVDKATNPSVQRLEALVGEWNTELFFRFDPPMVVNGRTTFEWLENGFLIQRAATENPEFPTGVVIIGADDALETYSQLHFDSRGISRVYQMSLKDGVWKIWREAPEFSQRFTGTFSEDGNTITCIWEILKDSTTWELDFDGTYTRVR